MESKNTLAIIKKYLSSYLWLDECGGGICLRERKGKHEILCIIHKNGGLALPKGQLKKGESPEKAAKREFEEETGIYGYKLGEKIGILRDRFRRKKITFFWFHNPSTQNSPFHDNATVWIGLEKALLQMRYKSEKKFLKRYIQ